MKVYRFICPVVVLTVVLSFGGFLPAQAAEGWYVGGRGNVTFVSDAESRAKVPGYIDSEGEFETGYGLAGAVGYGFASNFRLEGEISYRQADLDKIKVLGATVDWPGEASALGFMSNAYYDIDTGSPWKPYFMGGIGLANVNLEVPAGIIIIGSTILLSFGTDDDDTVFAYQAGVGIGYELTTNVVFDIGYRFFGTSAPEFTNNLGDPFESELSSHNIEIGVRFNF